jgi:KaiC/GvpD/RAD55 family RecA-like ATPase
MTRQHPGDHVRRTHGYWRRENGGEREKPPPGTVPFEQVKRERERAANGPDPSPPLTLAQWLERDLPEPDRVLGDLLSTTSRVLIVGPTGLGKTMFGIAAAMAMAEGQAFLHWRAGRKCRVLYVDGEISRREMKRRLRDAVRRAGAKPDGLCILSTEDYQDMPPLNTPRGQKWFDAFIEDHGGFDFIIFDNVQAFLAGNMKEEEQWAAILPWVRSLTRRSIGQIWFHHTGHSEDRSYGSKAREWQMDAVALMERVEIPGADLAFTLKFTKARERSPENRADFEPVTMSLKGGKWTYEKTEKASSGRLSDRQQLAFEALVSLATEHGDPLPASYELPQGILAVSVTAFKNEMLARGVVNSEASNPRARLHEIINGLKRHHVAGERDGRIWPIVK